MATKSKNYYNIRYKQNSYLLVFKFFANDISNIILYGASILIGFYLYSNGGIKQTLEKHNLL
jgi:hypothetical protein